MLNCHTYYSLRYGTLSPEQLVTHAVKHGVARMALTDIHNCTAIPEFVMRCRKQGIHPVAGMEFRESNRLLYIVLARNNEGFRRINAFMSLHNARGTPLPCRFPVCDDTFVVYPFTKHAHSTAPSGVNHAQRRPAKAGYREDAPAGTGNKPHPNEFTGIRSTELHHLYASPLRHTMERMVALQPVSFAHPDEHSLHVHLRAIHYNLLLSQLTPQQYAQAGEVMVPPDEMQKRYAGFAHILKNTERLLDRCSIDFDTPRLKNKKNFTGSVSDDRALLTKLAMEGLEYRYGKDNQEAFRRVRHEIDIIDKLGFSAYFLITWDIIRYSMSRGFYHVGRGSGANSIVAYCLRITDVDPVSLNLYFERFINPKRSSPPDFDIDYSWKDRDQVLDYIFKRYGSEHTALLGTISTFRERSTIRELSKVYGLPKSEADMMVSVRDRRYPPHSVNARILETAARLTDFPNLRSIHAGGVLVSEQPICCYAALDMPPKGMPTVQWDMYVAEELGFEKIDILSQRGIGHINDSVHLIRENRGVAVDIHRVESFKNDPKVKSLLQSGETTGCFYVESPAMRGLLKKLRCDSYPGLVAASSIIRPGVARSGMMRAYIERAHKPESIRYLHPIMKEQLRETFGVMVYQEDVIKVCHHFAGLDLADADVLRRAMSGKYRSKKEMQRVVDRFFESCRAKRHPEDLTREVWRQIESFAGYSFSKAHSASFAVESYQSLYLKAYYPLEFLTAVINNYGGFYQADVYLNEARRYGACIELPCVNHSNNHSSIYGRHIYIGLTYLRDLEHKTIQSICRERNAGGAFTGLEDFYRRTGTTLEQLLLLIRINAFRFTGLPKAQLMWKAHLLCSRKTMPAQLLFPVQGKAFDLPAPEYGPLQDAYDELELLGFTVSVSPFDMIKTSFRGDIMAADMLHHVGREVRMAGALVNIKYVRTVKNELMHFACFLDASGMFFDSVHFPDSLKKWPFNGKGVYLLQGIVCEEFGFPSLDTKKMVRLPMKPDPRV
ncbi:MAG: DNA polymerase III subunit alpha [Bacteroidales bacterium]|nr:DNA polymerase III subunit alpha [Bacteroidales bacterium]